MDILQKKRKYSFIYNGQFHKKEYEDGININDKKFNFKFKKKNFIISDKDKNWQYFNEFLKNLKSL